MYKCRPTPIKYKVRDDTATIKCQHNNLNHCMQDPTEDHATQAPSVAAGQVSPEDGGGHHEDLGQDQEPVRASLREAARASETALHLFLNSPANPRVNKKGYRL